MYGRKVDLAIVMRDSELALSTIEWKKKDVWFFQRIEYNWLLICMALTDLLFHCSSKNIHDSTMNANLHLSESTYCHFVLWPLILTVVKFIETPDDIYLNFNVGETILLAASLYNRGCLEQEKWQQRRQE